MESGAKFVTLDRQNPGELMNALGNGADAIVDVVAFDEGHADQLLALQSHVGAIAVVSSMSVYCDTQGRTLGVGTSDEDFPVLPVPIPETHETVAASPATYSTRKVALETRLLDNASCPVTILRPGAIHGPGALHPREWWFVKRFLDDRRVVPLKYRGQSFFSTTSSANLAGLTLTALENPGTRILNATNPDTPSALEIGSAIAKHMNVDCEFVLLGPQPEQSHVGQSPWSAPSPFVISGEAALQLGYIPVETYEQSVPAMCDWLLSEATSGDWRERFPVMAGYKDDPFDYAAEDAILAQSPA
jgi:nucleoside-diphosphate-sugar epimerase